MEIDILRKYVSKDKLNALQVGLVYLFGSQAEGVAGLASDIDIGVVFTDLAVARGDTREIYNRLYAIFSDLFDMSNFRDMDIVFLERVGLELRFDVVSHGKVLFEVSPDFRLDFEERTQALYRDFRPLLNEFNQAVLKRI